MTTTGSSGTIYGKWGRCGAKNRNGVQCGRASIPGGWVCHIHGGGARQVKIAAERRILEDAFWAATFEWEAARGTRRENSRREKRARVRWELERHDRRVQQLAETRAAFADWRTVRGTPQEADAYERAREALGRLRTDD